MLLRLISLAFGFAFCLGTSIALVSAPLLYAQPATSAFPSDQAEPCNVADRYGVLLPPVNEALPIPLTLTELEQLALQNNPALGVASANVAAARGRQIQGGLGPNPQIGYFGMDIGEDDTAGQHGGFVSKEFVTGGKLRLNRAVAGQEVREMQHQFSAQELRVLNDVRVRFYDALVAQRQVELTEELVGVSNRLVEASRRLADAQQISDSDLLQAEIEAEESAIAAATARNQSEEAWRRLAAAAGISASERRTLTGDLEGEIPVYSWDETYARVLATSPELASAEARVVRSRLSIQRARRENVPNVEVMASVSHMHQSDDDVAGVQVGIPLPIHNRNQGSILEAEANFIAAQHNVRRLELELQQRLAAEFRRYGNARAQAERYRQEILPRAQRSLDLVATGFREGQVDFLAVLTSQRTYVRVNLAYLAALAELRQAATVIEGQLLTGSLEAR